MLNKRIFAAGGSGGAAIVAVLLVVSLGVSVDVSVGKSDELPTKLGGGFPPDTELDVGQNVPQFITSDGNKVENPSWSKYKDLLIFDEYPYLTVFDTGAGEEDMFLSMEPMSDDETSMGVLHSGEFIWITKAYLVGGPDENLDVDYYSKIDLNDDQKLVKINDEVNAPVSGMTQLVDFDGEKIGILPLDLWLLTDDYSYSLRGHITEQEAIKLANSVLSTE